MFGLKLLIMFFSMLISHVKSYWRQKITNQCFNPSYVFISLFLIIIFLLTFTSFLKLKPKNQTTIDKHKYNIIILVRFHNTSALEKWHGNLVCYYNNCSIATICISSTLWCNDDNGCPHCGSKWNTKKKTCMDIWPSKWLDRKAIIE